MKDPVIISVGGGKGGIGKSTLTTNIGATLCEKGFTVGFIDADLGGANLHLCLGVKRPSIGLQDFIHGTCHSLEEAAVKTVLPGSWLISGASDIVELANPHFNQKQKMITAFKKLSADFIFVDLGAGSSYNVTDFFSAFPFGIIVTDGLPTSIENAYGFLKNGIVRGLMRLFPGKPKLQNRIKQFVDPATHKKLATMHELFASLCTEFPHEVQRMQEWLHGRRPLLVLNMVEKNEEIQVGKRFIDIVRKYLSVTPHYIGYLIQTPAIRDSIKHMRPVVISEQSSPVKECFDAISRNLTRIIGM